MKNIELKVRRRSAVRDRATCVRLGARFVATLRQCDTYFAACRGRLKLREQRPGRAELIAYLRPDEPRARACRYAVIPIPDPDQVRAFLGECLGVLAQVRKVRDLFLRGGVRIHVDRVRGLGTFLEFEAVLKRGRTAGWGRAAIRRLMDDFSVDEADIVSDSYLDLVVARQKHP